MHCVLWIIHLAIESDYSGNSASLIVLHKPCRKHTSIAFAIYSIYIYSSLAPVFVVIEHLDGEIDCIRRVILV